MADTAQQRPKLLIPALGRLYGVFAPVTELQLPGGARDHLDDAIGDVILHA